MNQLKKDIIESFSVKDGKNITSWIKETFVQKNYPDVYNQIIEYYNTLNILNKEVSFKDKIWIWVNEEKDFPRCKCGNYTSIYPKWQSGYRENCSYECLYTNPDFFKRIRKTLDNLSDDEKKNIKEKIKKTNLEKYGVEHFSKTNNFKEKTKKTNLERYGVEHYSKTDEYVNRVKETSIQKWGVDNFSKTVDFIKKSSTTNLEKYGVDNYTKTDDYKNRVKKINKLKWGVEHYMSTEDFKNKSKETILKKYGVEHFSKTEEYKQKVKNTSIEKWGVDNYTKTDEYIEKRKITLISKIGVESIKANEEYRKMKFNIANDENYISYLNNSISKFRCDLGEEHDFKIDSTLYNSRKKSNLPLCTICYPINKTSSIVEDMLYNYIKSIYSGDIIKTYKDGLEIDIYLPELKLGFEYNGLYWHSDSFIDRGQHLRKIDFFKDKGIRVIHIWEDDWNNKNEIIKSQIKNWIGVSNNKIWARKCEIREAEVKDSLTFLESNHIQGAISSKIKLGLYYNNELISLMTFDQFEGRKKMNQDEWNLSRFCNKLNYNVVGGASKLLNYFIKHYNPSRIISYADKDWSNGNLYEKLGFNKLYETKPDYKYVVNKKRIHKSNFKKSITKVSESKLEIPKIWDCGKIKFELYINV